MHETQGATISKRGFAELVGVSPGRVSQMIKDGLPVEVSGRVNIEAGRSWITANIDPNRRRIQMDDGGGVVRSSKVKRENAEAEIARLRADRMAESLIDRAATLQAIEGRARLERDCWIGWVNRAAPEIAAATGGDLAVVVATLDCSVREHLAALAETPIEGLS